MKLMEISELCKRTGETRRDPYGEEMDVWDFVESYGKKMGLEMWDLAGGREPGSSLREADSENQFQNQIQKNLSQNLKIQNHKRSTAAASAAPYKFDIQADKHSQLLDSSAATGGGSGPGALDLTNVGGGL